MVALLVPDNILQLVVSHGHDGSENRITNMKIIITIVYVKKHIQKNSINILESIEKNT